MAKQIRLTQEDAEKAAADYFTAEHELLRIKSEKQLAIQAIEDKYRNEENEAKAKAETAKATLQTYSEANREKLLVGKAKSFEIGRVSIGWRVSKGSLTVLDGKSWDDVLQQAKQTLPDYVKVTESLEKDKILKDIEAIGEKLNTVGLKVEVAENIILKLKD